MSETDEEFIARMEKWSEPGSDADRLFALARRGAEMQWRPIESAPTKSGLVVVWLPDVGVNGVPAIAQWDERYGSWYSYDHGMTRPTHWMPLPSPPTGESDEP